MAAHYAAYRPPLHKLILEKLLQPDEHFESGLDIGCGTGYSAIELSNYCDHVTALDPSESMIEQATPHPKVKYIHGNEDKLSDLASQSIDVVTFAGSLFYAKSPKLYQQLVRLLKPTGILLVYDFQVLLEEPLKELGLRNRKVESDYQYVVDLTDWPRFRLVTSNTEKVEIELPAEKLAHVLLADSFIYNQISDHLNATHPFQPLVSELKKAEAQKLLAANLYYTQLKL